LANPSGKWKIDPANGFGNPAFEQQINRLQIKFANQIGLLTAFI
jgi:hypothetical protein